MPMLNPNELLAGGLGAALAPAINDLDEDDKLEFNQILNTNTRDQLESLGLAGNTRKTRLKNYARLLMAFGLGQPFKAMTNPPILTKGNGQQSTVNTNYVNNNVQYTGQSPAISWLGGDYTDATLSGSIPTRAATWTTSSNGTRSGESPRRLRFITDSEAIDVNFIDRQDLAFNLMVDGEFAYRSKPFSFTNTGNHRWVRVDFGVNELTYALDHYPSVTTPGTGYAVNDLVTLDGGTNSAGGTPAVIRVAQIGSNGGIALALPHHAGNYTSMPQTPIGQASTNGSGTGAVFSTAIFAKRNTTRKMRRIELIITGGSPAGLVIPPGRTMVADPENIHLPRIVFVGDSITANTYQAYAGCGLEETIAQRLRLWERFVTSAQGGTGWNKDNGVALRWSHPTRITDVVALNPDIVVYIGSQNDATGAPLEAAITSTLTTLQSQLPDTLFVGIGNIMGDSTTLANSIGSGWSGAPDQSRVRYINNHAPRKWIPSTHVTDWATQGDANHPHDDALNWFAAMAATSIGNAIVEMVSLSDD